MKDSIRYGRTSSSPQIAYASCGSGKETVFFLHGIGGNKNNWLDQLVFFAGQGYRAVAWDVRGYGDSDDYDGGFRFEDISADLLRLMSDLNVKTAHFVGLSMGGRILMDFAYRHADRIDSLVICGAFPSFGKALSPEQREDFLRLRKQPLLEGRTFSELAPELIASLAGPDVHETVYAALHQSICRLRRDSYLKALEAAVYFDRSNEIRSIPSRTLLLYAENDRLTPPDMGRDVEAAMPNAQMHVLPRSGHLMNIEVPEAFNQVVYEFISKEQHHE